MDPLPILFFSSPSEWWDWLHENHAGENGLWLKLAKKNSGLVSVSYMDAVETALCWGWIDGQKKAFDDQCWIQRFTPRKPRSIWSQINKEKALRLIAENAMQPAGMKAIEAAKKSGMWDNAYAPASTITIPKDLARAFKKNPAAHAHFKTLNSQNRFAILHRIQKVKKEETRAKKITEFIELLEQGGFIYPK
ncbi:MAG: YdeI/OmpD-associated family protein [Flavobacteriales bacterium]|nr:YdeI/OmpD-associated family protein [Flavobacteriales bacterium]